MNNWWFGILGTTLTLQAAATAQPLTGSAELQMTAVATGVSTSSDIAVDGQGNVWIPSVTGTTIRRVSPGGVVTSFPFAAGSDLVRGLDGNIWFWLPNTTTMAAVMSLSLMRLDPDGAITTVIPGIQTNPWFSFGRGIAQDASGAFYFGAGDGRILRLAAGASSFESFGSTPGETRLASDPGTGAIYSGSSYRIHRVPPTGWNVAVYGNDVTPVPAGTSLTIHDHDVAWSGQVVALVNPGQPWLEVVACSEPHVYGALARIPDGWPGSPSLARGLGGDLYVASGDTLWRLTGTPATLTSGIPTGFNPLRLRLDGPPGNPILVTADAPGFALTVPAIGTFGTSLGLLPSFLVLADTLGIFTPAAPATGTPWTRDIQLPPSPLGVSFAVQGHVFSPTAANGLVMISNPLVVTL